MADIDPRDPDAGDGVEVAQISLPPLGGAGAAPLGAAGPGNSEPIGQIENAAGGVTIVRVDGTRVEGSAGTPIFQGDSVETAADGSIGIVFSDATTFSLGPEGSMVIDEMIYDPEAGEGSMSLNIANGVFSLVSGQIAKITPDSMTIDTPVATIGIRGTDIAGQAGEINTLTLLPGADGTLGEAVYGNAMGSVILNTLFSTSTMQSAFVPATKPLPLNQAAVDQLYGAATRFLPSQPPPGEAPFSPGIFGGADAGSAADDGDPDDGPTEEQVAAAAEAAAAQAAGEQLTPEQEAALAAVETELTPDELAAAVEQELQAQETLANAQDGPSLSPEEEAIANAFLEVLQTGGSLTDAFAAAGTTQSLIASGVPLDQLEQDTGPLGPPEDEEPPEFIDFDEEDEGGEDDGPGGESGPGSGGDGGGEIIILPIDGPIFIAGPIEDPDLDPDPPPDGPPLIDLEATLGDDFLDGTEADEDVLMIQGENLGGSDELFLEGGFDHLGLAGLSYGWGVLDANSDPTQVTYTFGNGLSSAPIAGTILLDGVDGVFVEAGNLTVENLLEVGLGFAEFSDGTVGLDIGFFEGSSGYFVVGAGDDGMGDSLSLADGETADGLLGASGVDSSADNLSGGILFGLGGADNLQGSYTNDVLVGGEGNDVLNGGEGDDHLIGGEGDDDITGGYGEDNLTGGSGADTFNFGSPSEFGDRITDFTVGKDLINYTLGTTDGASASGSTLFANGKASNDLSSGTAGIYEFASSFKSLSVDLSEADLFSIELAAESLLSVVTTGAAVTDNLVVLYDADDNAGLFRLEDTDGDGAVDSGEVSLVAILQDVEADSLTAADFTGYTSGLQALQFNGTDNKTSATTTFSGSFSVEAWVNVNAFGAFEGFVTAQNGGDTTNFMQLTQADGTGVVQAEVMVGGTQLNVTSGSTTLTAGSWHHVAMTYDGGTSTLTLYLDGQDVTTPTAANGSPGNVAWTSFPTNVGVERNGSGGYLDGSVADVRIWSDVRTAAEIEMYDDQVLTGTEAGLEHYWRFNGDLTNSASANSAVTMTSSGATQSYTTDGPSLTTSDPLVLDLDGDGIELLGADAGVTFDRDGDGVAENTGWFGPDDGLLVADLNENGRVDDFSEVVSPTFAYRGGVASSTTTSFDALALFDDNDDGSISVLDEIFGMLKIWQDGNSDGQTQVNELLDLSDVGITSISLATSAPDPQDILGNTLWRSAEAQTDDGGTMEVAEVTFATPAEAEPQSDQTDPQVA